MRRLAHGDGSVFYEKDRARWVGSIDLGVGPNGKRRRRRVTGATSAEVTGKLKKLRDQAAAGVDLAQSSLTVAELLERWKRDVLPGRGSPSTVSNYSWAIDNHLIPHLGRHKLEQLRAEHVEAMLRALADDDKARNTVSRIRFVLATAIRWAQRRDLVIRNVAELAELPVDARAPRDARALTPDEAARLIAATKGTKKTRNRLEALWVTALGLGVRPGELTGLTWADVDLDEGVLHIRRSMKYLHDVPIGLGDVKTGHMGRGRRSLTMPGPVIAAMRRHKAAQAVEKLALGHAWPAEWSELVFVSIAGTPLRPANLRRDLDALATKAKIGHVTRYDLRHSAATLLVAMGVRLEDVADLLGHENLRMARSVYVHATARPLDVALQHGGVLGA